MDVNSIAPDHPATSSPLPPQAPLTKTLSDRLITPLSDSKEGAEFQPPRAPGAFVPLPEDPQEDPSDKHSLSDLATAVKDTEWAIRSTDAVEKAFKDYDENAPKATEDDWDALDDSYDKDQMESLRDLLDEGASMDEWNDQLEEFAITNKAQEVVDDFGVSGVGAQFVAALADPTFLAATSGSIVLGDKISGLLLAGAKAKRLSALTAALARAGFTSTSARTRFARGLGEVVLADGAYSAIKSQTINDYSDMDMAVDLLTSFAVVGGFESVSALKAARAADTLAKANAEKLVRELEEKGELALKEQGEVSEELTQEIRDAGAKETESEAGRWRPDDFGRLMNSGNSELKFFAEHALQDAVGGGADSAAVLAARTREHLVGELNREFYTLWKGHKKTLGRQGPIQQAKEMSDLSEKLWEAVVLGADHGPEVRKAAAAIAKQNAEVLKAAQESGLNGFKDIASSEGYMKQEWDMNGWRKVRTGPDALDDSEISELIHKGLDDVDEVPLAEQLDQAKLALDEYQTNNAVKSEVPQGKDKAGEVLAKEVKEIEDLIAARKRLAMGFTNRMINKSDGETKTLSELLEDEDSLVKWLKEDDEFRNATEEEISAFVKKALGTRSRNNKKNVVDRAKRRISINPAATITKGTRTHRVADLMSRDAMGLQQSYIHEMTGNIAFAKRLGIKGPKEWMEMKNAAHRKELEVRNGDANADKKAQRVVELMEEMKKEVFGHNRNDLSGDWSRVGSVLMKYNFMTAMGKAAFSAMSEMGRIMAENRVRNVLKVIPSLNTMITDSFRTVNKHSSIVKEVNGFNASIGDEHLVRYFNSFDETGVKEGRFTEGALNKTEIIMHRGARLMAKASLLAPVDKMLRMVSFQSSVNSLHSHLMKGQKSRLAFAEMGMNKGLRDRIKASMEKHGVETDFWGNVTKLNIEKWDRATADEMMDALTTNGARQVQKTFAGENTAITSHPVGRIFMQFRKFALDSYTKHLRADIRSARNGQAIRVMLSNSYAVILAGIGYSSRTYVSTLGMDDEDTKKYLDERLAGPRLAANMAAYTPALGPVVSAWNIGPGLLFPDAVIPVSRASGLDNRSIGSNPTTAAINRVGSMFHDIGETKPESILSKGRFSIPFQNTIWGDILLNNAARIAK